MLPHVRLAIVSGFDTIIGQQLPIRLLRTFLSKRAVPHALLFTGLRGIGKRTSARVFAAALNCRRRTDPETADHSPPLPCGQCRSCTRILADRHPDVLIVEPQGTLLRINQIRQLRTSLAMKPFSADQRVVIITNGQCMNAEAGNALLKILEEPPTDTILIITALQKSDLLPTIVSRCRHIPFAPLDSADICAHLIDTRGADPDQARSVAAICQGSLSTAIDLLSGPWREERDWVIRAAGLDSPDHVCRRPLSATLAFAAQLAAHKDRIQDLLDTLKTWIRDLSVYRYRSRQITNGDLEDLLQKASPQTDPNQLLHWWKTVEKAQKDIAANANLRLTLDLMAIQMATNPPFTA
jgi:DNA polymerase III subunit delta'